MNPAASRFARQYHLRQWQTGPTVFRGIRNPTYSEFHGQSMITFSYDDGQITDYNLAMPLHGRYNIPFTVNIVTSYIDNPARPGFLTSHQIRTLDGLGVEIASHSHTHPRMTELSDEQVAFEFSESKRILSGLASRVETYAAPNSDQDERTKGIGSQYFEALRVGGDEIEALPPIDRYALRAKVVRNYITTEQIKGWVDDAVASSGWLIVMMHGLHDPAVTSYSYTPAQLEEVLVYVASFDRDVLLPVNTRDGIRFALELGDYPG